MVSLVKQTIFGMIDLMTDEINPNIKLGTQITTLQFAITYGEFNVDEIQ